MGRRGVLLPASDWNKSNTVQPVPPLQPSTDTPQLLGLFLCERRDLHADRIVTWSIEHNAGGDDRIAVLDEHALSPRQHVPDLSILLGHIFDIVRNKWLGGQLIDFCIILRVEHHRTIGIFWRNWWYAFEKQRSPINGADRRRRR